MASPLPASSAEPFVTGDPTAPARAVLFHGFTGTPYEVLPLAHHLATRGIHSVGPLLPGHGRSPAALAESTAGQFMAEATRALLEATADGRRVVVGGLSMGGLVATCLTAAHPERVSALVLMAPAFRLYNSGQAAIRCARAGIGSLFPVIPKGVPGGDCEDAEGRRRNPAYLVVPTGGLPALGDMQRAGRESLPLIRVPTLILHGQNDRTVPVGVSVRLPRALRRAPSVELHVLRHSRHLLPLDVERDVLFGMVETFLRKHGVLQPAEEKLASNA